MAGFLSIYFNWLQHLPSLSCPIARSSSLCENLSAVGSCTPAGSQVLKLHRGSRKTIFETELLWSTLAIPLELIAVILTMLLLSLNPTPIRATTSMPPTSSFLFVSFKSEKRRRGQKDGEALRMPACRYFIFWCFDRSGATDKVIIYLVSHFEDMSSAHDRFERYSKAWSVHIIVGYIAGAQHWKCGALLLFVYSRGGLPTT